MTVHDIRQGALGNCWFISAASALAEVPSRLENIFINEDDAATNGISENGIYALRFYALMEPIVVTIDDRAPFRENKEMTLYAKVGEDHSVWAPLLEKAFAKFHGTYEAIIGGSTYNALRTLANSPGTSMGHKTSSTNDLWKALKKADLDKDIITAACCQIKE